MKIDVRNSFPLGVMALVLSMSGSARAGIVETYEAAGVMNTTTKFNGAFGIETFDARATGTGGFSSTLGNNGTYTGTYSSGTGVQTADMYGGAGGAGNYAVTFTGGSYSLSLNRQVTYFGYWLSALDAGNIVNFYSGGTQVGSLSQAGLLAAIGSNSAYYGNPNGAFAGQNNTQPYAFVNFYATNGTTFDTVMFTEDARVSGGYETDNHTVGNFVSITGTALPEPSSCALVVLALAGLGASRTRRHSNRA